jgi:hypothetical protein
MQEAKAMEAIMEHGTDLLATRDNWDYAERRLVRRSWRSPFGLGVVLISAGVMAVLLRVAIVGFPVDFNAILISLGVTAVLLRIAVQGF